MANYVKFRKGSLQAYQNLALKDDDTLYFIIDQDDDNVQLYLGSKLISGGEISDLSIGDLQDTSIGELADRQILVYDSNHGAWVNTNYRNLIEEFVGATENSAGVSGLVPAPGEGNTNLFLRSDGEWVSIEQPDNEITLTGENPISIDENGVIKLLTDNTTIGIIEKGLSIVGFEDANIGAIPTKTENGLEWIVPEASRDEEFAAAISNLISEINSLKSSVGQSAQYDDEGSEIIAASGLYAKIDSTDAKVFNLETLLNEAQNNISNLDDRVEQTENDLFEYNQIITELQNGLIATNENVAKKANITDVFTKQETNLAIEAAIAAVDHLKRKTVVSIDVIDKTAKDADQYIYLIANSEGTYDEYMVIEGELEKVGDWKTDLSDYTTKNEFEQSILSLTTEINKKANIVYYPVKNEETNEIEQVPGAFLSPSDQEKLNALVIDKDGNVGISGNVNVDNVIGLEDWLNENKSNLPGLSENNLTDEMVNKLVNSIYISSVDETQLQVNSGKLSITAITPAIVTGLTEALALKADNSDFDTLNESLKQSNANISDISNNLTDVANALNSLSGTVSQHSLDIEELKDSLEWKTL